MSCMARLDLHLPLLDRIDRYLDDSRLVPHDSWFDTSRSTGKHRSRREARTHAAGQPSPASSSSREQSIDDAREAAYHRRAPRELRRYRWTLMTQALVGLSYSQSVSQFLILEKDIEAAAGRSSCHRSRVTREHTHSHTHTHVHPHSQTNRDTD